MKVSVVTKLRLITFSSSILFLWDDKSILAGSVPHCKEKLMLDETQDNSQFPKFIVIDKPGGKKGLIEIERTNGRKESVQRQAGV